ncbi:WD40-repeat-containing domain protein [Xylariaceae sp. FL0594]|nr:WD40-repeat-containing domain protein [Xylariaceae sp. FL0594]
MSSPQSHSEASEDLQTDPYFDAEEDDRDDGDYDEEDDEDEDDEDDEQVELFHEMSEEDADFDDEFHDAEEENVEIMFSVGGEDEEDGEGEGEGGEASQGTNATQSNAQRTVINLINFGHRAGIITQREILSILQGRNMGIVLHDDDYGGEAGTWAHRMRRRPAPDPNRFPKVPSDKGRELMNSGSFGTTDLSSRKVSKKNWLARRILDRELGLGDWSYRRMNQGIMAQSMIPRTEAEMIINFHENVYSGQFSDDGNFFYACVKDFKVRMYDTSNPYNWRHYKTVAFPFGSWTLTDATLSPDNKWLAYTSIQSNVCLAPTDPNDTGDPYTLSLTEHGNPRAGQRGPFGIWSVRFSGDGRELVAGTNSDAIVVYDIESRTVLHHINGHDNDVNAVCFADKSSPHILYSGSDDTTIKVWDRRSMGDGREAGAFVGHIEGLTYIDSKDDGRYLLSNGKDQSMKLWDLKMMYTSAQFREKNPRQHIPHSNFDYRWSRFNDGNWFPHPDDNSVVTFRGHRVLRTLIRCHFSPPSSTNSRYVYSGSHDGKVHIWNMDATPAATIDVKKATAKEDSLPAMHRRVYRRRGFTGWSTIVRDASWHPNAPFIAASALNSWDNALGTVSLHGYNEGAVDEGFPEMGIGYDEKIRPVGGDAEPDDGGQFEEEEAEGGWW